VKVLIFGEDYPDSLARNVACGFEDIGHEIHSVHHTLLSFGGKRWIARLRLAYYARRFFPRLDRRFHLALVRHAATVQPDLVVVVRTVPPRIIEEIKRVTSAVVVFWFPDAISNLGRQEMLQAPYDALFFKDRVMVETFRQKLGLTTFLLQEGCNPRWHVRPSLTPEERTFYGCDLTVAGNAYAYRARMLENFLDYDVKLWGGDWPIWLESPARRFHQRRYVAELDKAKAYNAAKIVLNTMHYAEIEGFNARLFEAAGCGGFQIIDWKACLQDYFEPEREVVTFRTLEELKEKVAFYLRHDAERQVIANRAYDRAHAEHTYAHRARQMLTLLFGKAPAP
jgi:spore maturation protein CgeB